MTTLPVYFGITFFLALSLTPLFRRIALHYKVFAHRNSRTIHIEIVPKLGGGAIFVAFLIGALCVLVLKPEIFLGHKLKILGLFCGGFIISVLGTIDDKFDLGCNLKLLVELVIALVMVMMGWRFETLLFPGLLEVDLHYLSIPVSVLWIVGIANAINLIDGLDGLASGIIIVASLVILAVAGLYNNPLIMTLSVLLAGAVAGFLRYNVNPASIFMGDSGSLMLGFIVGCTSIQASAISTGKHVILIPILLLALPITDTLLAIVRRIRRGVHPFHADQEHIHHRLVKLGMNQSMAALIMVAVSFVFGILAFWVAKDIQMEVILMDLFSAIR